MSKSSGVLPSLNPEAFRATPDDLPSRVTRVETSQFYLSKQIEAMHADLKTHMEEEAEQFEKTQGELKEQKEEITSLQRSVVGVKSDIKWTKRIFVAIKAGIIGYLGVNKP